MLFRSPKQVVASSEPNFWIHSLQIHCNGLGLKSMTLQLAPSVGSCLCDNECNSLLGQGQTPKGKRRWRICWATRAELPGGSQPNRPLAPCVRPSSPPRAKRPTNLEAGPFWASMEEGGGRKTLSRGSATGIVLEDWYWCLLTHSSN